jgi:hypothetical protein
MRLVVHRHVAIVVARKSADVTDDRTIGAGCGRVVRKKGAGRMSNVGR